MAAKYWQHAVPKDVTVSAHNAEPSSKRDLLRLKKRADFLRVAAGKRWTTPYFVLQTAPAAYDAMAVGFTVTKKQGNAVVRNRIKRRLKELTAQVMPLHARSDADYVLIGRAAAEKAPFAELQRNLEWALRRIHGDIPKQSD